MFLPSDAKNHSSRPRFISCPGQHSSGISLGELGAITVLRRRRLRLAVYSGLWRRWFCLILPYAFIPDTKPQLHPNGNGVDSLSRVHTQL